MGKIDWTELWMLRETATKALLSGELHEQWQHVSTSTFHLLSTYLLDINDRLARLESSATESVASGIILDTE